MGNKVLQNLIIGAGPAGLAVAGRLRHHNIPFEILEQSDKIAYSWHNHYDRLSLHTVKDLSHLPYLPFPSDYPLYVPRQKLVAYYEEYAKHFNIVPHFNTEVLSVCKNKEVWEIETNNGIYLAEHVIVATGVNRIPSTPRWNQQEEYKGTIVHSKFYKNPKPYVGQKVLIIGMGNTGAELALDLSEHDVDVTVSVRSSLLIVPRDINGRPVQTTAKKLEKLPLGLGRWIGKQVRKIVIGNLSSYGITISKEDPIDHLKNTGKTPVIDLGTVKHIKDGNIKIIGDINHFTSSGIKTISGETLDYDTVILATGYTSGMIDLIKNIDDFLDSYGVPKKVIGMNQQQGLFFIGFDNYKLGGILGTIYNDSETIVNEIVRQGL